MVQWLYVPDRRLTLKETREAPKNRECIVGCGGHLLRVAERVPVPPYQWLPNGYICDKCNVMIMGVP